MNKWIKTTDKLPSENELVLLRELTVFNNENINTYYLAQIVYKDKNYNWFDCGADKILHAKNRNFTHWMKTPKPPNNI